MLEARDAIVLVLLALLAAASMLAYLWGADPNSLVIAATEKAFNAFRRAWRRWRRRR